MYQLLVPNMLKPPRRQKLHLLRSRTVRIHGTAPYGAILITTCLERDIGDILRRAAAVGWNGFKFSLKVLNEASSSVPILDSVVSGLVSLLDIYEVRPRPSEDSRW